MPLKVSQSGDGEFELLPAGQYVARCFKVIDLGTQDIEWNGETKQQPKIMVSWEILDDEVKMADGRPFAVSKQYTASLNEKSNLYKDLVSWRGQAFTKEELLGFDISKLLGAYCQIQVVHNESNGKTYANVNTIMGTKERPKAINKDVVFDILNPDMTIFESFSDWLKGKIRQSDEWRNNVQSEHNKPQPSEDVEVKDITIEDLKLDDEEIDLKDIPF